jgi:hypothetical protein
MGLSYTGMSCLLTACVTGYRRVPEPPAKIMPFRLFMFRLLKRYALIRFYRWQTVHANTVGT